ncbi:AAA family ATPase [Amycolatopsis australiensis]|uniref:Regulatory protein, luxR family n=1 Tax=Amycolatopsis australiensis TaxID=546364 RepID=A0A1K1RVJ7_9PSEU|nr:AAA family ATPase [Amycolatopsis australiensis]SFW75852.1 regulatory protein, luxR family [Amycolatopsis australiensis]
MTLPEREEDLRRLRDAIAAAGAGQGSVTVVTGQLGAGKTALLKEIRDTAGSGTRLLTASASRSEQDFDFGVACQLLEPLVAEAGPADADRWFAGDAAAARWLFPGVAGWPGWRGEQAEVLTTHGLLSLLARIAADRPLAVLVDDLQDADRQSLTWLRQCARRIDELPCALVGTVREGDPGADRPAIRELWQLAKTRIRPANLSEAGVRELLGGDARAAACHAASAGNPLYLTEVLRDGHSRDAGPSLLQERLSAQLAALPPHVGACAEAIAVLGEHAQPWLIEHLTGGDSVAVAEAVRILRRLGILGPASPPRFAAPVVRTAIEASMSAHEDRRLRVRAATAFHDAGFAAETVAAQLLELPAPSPSLWMAEELRTAADAATRRGEPETAARYLRRALLDLPPDCPERGWRLVDLALTEAVFDLPAAIRHLTQAIGLLPTPRERAEAVTLLPLSAFLRPEAAVLTGRVSQADTGAQTGLWLEARIRLTRCDDPASLMSALVRLRELGPEPPIRTLAERELLAVLLYAATLTAGTSADTVAELAGELLRCAPASSAELAGTAPLLILAALTAGAIGPTSSWLDSAIGEASGRGPVRLASLTGGRAAVLAHSGQLTRARATAAEALEFIGGDLAEASAPLVLCLVSVAVITRDERLAATVLGHYDEPALERAGLAIRAAVLMLRGAVTAVEDPRGALARFLDCGAVLHRAGWRNPAVFPWRTWSAWLQRRLGDHVSAAELIDEEVRCARQWGAPVALGRALRIQASLHSGAEADRMVTESIAVSRASEDRLEQVRALLAEGASLSGAEAADRFREARRLAEGCGAPWLTGRTAENTSGPGTGPGRATAPALSEAEGRVVGYVLNGLTNGEIAAEINVSRRAVEKHLTSCYRKLGISGRAELAAVFGAWGFGSRSGV